MDSKLTLVVNQETIQIVFSRNSALNTDLLINGQPRYTVSTVDRHAKETTIVDILSKQELVSIHRRTLLPDKIAFANRRGGTEHKISSIMKNHKMDDGYTAHMINTELGDIYWKVHKIHRLALFSMSDPVEPVAYREIVNSPIETFALVVRREYEPILDYIIATFLVLEQGLRMREKQSEIGEGVASYNRTLLGNIVRVDNLPQ